MKLGGVVILYHPNITEIENNLSKYIKDLDLLVLWDNTPGGTKDINRFLKHPNIIIKGTGNNEGISKALNEAFYELKNRGYDYVLTMDQDSCWEDFSTYKAGVEKKLQSNYGIYAPQIKSNNIILRVNSDQNVITSGSIVSMEAFEKIRGFNEKLFIDEVDNEFCFRLRKYGYEIKVLSSSYLVQIFGTPTQKGFLSKYTANYSPFRTYHQIRNRIWVWKRYHHMLSPKYILRTLLYQIIRRSMIILLIEDNKRLKLKAIYKGIRDGLTSHLD